MMTLLRKSSKSGRRKHTLSLATVLKSLAHSLCFIAKRTFIFGLQCCGAPDSGHSYSMRNKEFYDFCKIPRSVRSFLHFFNFPMRNSIVQWAIDYKIASFLWKFLWNDLHLFWKFKSDEINKNCAFTDVRNAHYEKYSMTMIVITQSKQILFHSWFFLLKQWVCVCCEIKRHSHARKGIQWQCSLILISTEYYLLRWRSFHSFIIIHYLQYVWT